MKTIRITHIHMGSAIRIIGGISFGAGFIAGILYSFGGLAYDSAFASVNAGTALAFMALIGMPILYGAIGLVIGVFAVAIFNFIAKRFGGIAIDVAE